MDPTLVDAMTATAQRISTRAGVRVVVDPRDVNAPCVLLSPPTISNRFGKGTWTGQWTAWLITTDAGRAQAVKGLSDLLDRVIDALACPFDGRAGDLILPDGTVPAYAVTWTDRARGETP